MNSLHSKRKFIALVYHSIFTIIIMVGTATNNNFLVGIGVFHFLTFKRIPILNIIQSRLITFTHCPSCRKKIILIGFWKCSCNYTPPTPQHILEPCQQCGRVYSHFKCPRCGLGILV